MKFVTEEALKVILKKFEKKILSSLEHKETAPNEVKPAIEKVPRRRVRGKK